MPGLEFRVLGAVEVWRGGEPVVPGRGVMINLLAALLVSANTVVTAERPPVAAVVLDEAIGLWRGMPLSNADSAVLHNEVVPGLVERYLSVCEHWAAMCLRLQRPGQAAERLVPLVAGHPFRESLVAQLMLAQYRAAGRLTRWPPTTRSATGSARNWAPTRTAPCGTCTRRSCPRAPSTAAASRPGRPAAARGNRAGPGAALTRAR